MNKPFFLTILSFLSKFTGFLRVIVFAHYYGTSFESDAFSYLMALDTILFLSIAMSLPNVIVPELIRCNNDEKRNQFVSTLVLLMLLIATSMQVFAICFPDAIIHILAPGLVQVYSVNNYNRLIRLTKFIFVSNFFMGMTYICIGVLQYLKKFIFSISVASISNIVLVFFIILCQGKEKIEVIIWVLIITYILQLIFVLVPILKYGFKISFSRVRLAYLKKFIGLFIPVLVGVSVVQFNALIDKSIGSFFGKGALSSLEYGYRVSQLPYAIIVAAIIPYFYSSLSQYAVHKSTYDYEKEFIYVNKLLIFILFGISSLFIVLGEQIVQIIYAHGKFNDEDIKIVTNIMAAYSLGYAICGARDWAVRGFYSFLDTRTPMICSILGVALNIILDFVFSYKGGLVGIALASSFSAFFMYFLLLIQINKKYHVKLKGIVSFVFNCLAMIFFTKIIFSYMNKKIIILINNIYFKFVVSASVFLVIYIILTSVMFFCINKYKGKEK